MLRLHEIRKTFGKEVLLDDVSLQMEAGERLGLIGRNGTGKTTLFRIIMGHEGMDSGEIIMPRGYHIGYLTQNLELKSPTVLEVGCEGLRPEEKYDHYKVEEILFGLGFDSEDLNRHPNELSGGFQVRLSLARALVAMPNLLLLDEPTNYLDIVAIRWITRFLRSWKHEMIIISHDREFLDNVTTHTAILHRQKLLKVGGNTAKLETLIDEQEKQYEKQRLSEEKLRKELETFIDKNHANPATAVQARSRRRMLERIPDRQKLETLYNLELEFCYADFPGKVMMEVNDLNFYYEPSKPLIQNLSFHITDKDRIAVIGKNGKGKSTLLRLLAGELTPRHGKIKPSINTKIGFFGQTNIERLSKGLTVEEEIENSNPLRGRTVVRGICGAMMFSGDNALKKIEFLSGGEKSRVLLGKIISTPSNLVLLDEPTNHLDVQSVEALIDSLEHFPGAVVIVTHDEMILKRLAKKFLVFQHGKVDLFHGGYEDFLRRVGWEDEAGLKTNSDKSRLPGKSKKELRKQRGQLLNEKSAVLKPFKEKIEKLETKIYKLEKELEETQEALQKANEEQKINELLASSRKAGELQEEINKTFDELEKATKLYNEKNEYFDKLLSSK